MVLIIYLSNIRIFVGTLNTFKLVFLVPPPKKKTPAFLDSGLDDVHCTSLNPKLLHRDFLCFTPMPNAWHCTLDPLCSALLTGNTRILRIMFLRTQVRMQFINFNLAANAFCLSLSHLCISRAHESSQIFPAQIQPPQFYHPWNSNKLRRKWFSPLKPASQRRPPLLPGGERKWAVAGKSNPWSAF